jgi:hypothetical protein
VNARANWTNALRLDPSGAGAGAGAVKIFTVDCKDAFGRELELELGVKFAL